MATARSPGGGSSASPQARLGLDLSQFRSAPGVARAYAQATAREISQAFKTLQAEQKLAQTQAQQTLSVLRGQEAQATAAARAGSSERIAAARTESAQKQEAYRRETIAFKEAEKRKTADHMAEIRAREQAQRQSQVSVGSFGRGVSSFAGAALGGPIGGLVGAAAGGSLPLAAGLAVGQGVRFAVEASQTATAYDRQRIAAVSLAGSQTKLNELTTAYTRATGGAIDKAAALSNITRLQATGFADDAEELERFTRGVRGASIAMGKTQDEIGQEVQLAISNRSFKRLDQIGLGIQEVTNRIATLRAANRGMSEDAAFQEAVLGLLGEKFGALTTSVEGQATGVERLTVAWANLRLEMGQNAKGPINRVAGALAGNMEDNAAALAAGRAALETKNFKTPADATEAERKGIQAAIAAQDRLDRKRDLLQLRTDLLRAIGAPAWVQNTFNPDQGPKMGGGAANQFGDPVVAPIRRGPAPVNEEARQAKLDWARGITDLNAKTHDAILAEETSFGLARAKTVADFAKSTAREERDFGRMRLRQNLERLDAIADIYKDQSRREGKAAADLARSNAQARADSEETIAEAREGSGKRLVELDEKYNKDREKAQRDLNRNLLDAAGHLDANQVYELQRNYAEQAKEAEEAHDEQRDELGEALKAREDDEKKALDKSIKRANEAAERQLVEARENDRLRVEDMKADFAKRKAQEDEDRAIRLGDREADYAAQLLEMDAQHGLRLNQIRTNALREREALQLAADDALIAAEAADAATRKRHEDREKAEEKLWDDFHKHITDSLTVPRALPGGPVKAYASGGYVAQTGLARVHAGEFMLSRAMLAGAAPIPPAISQAAGNSTTHSRSVTIQAGAVVVYGAPGQSEERIAELAIGGLIEYLESEAA